MCEYSHMTTNLSIDPELLEKALEVSGEKTKKAVVTQLTADEDFKHIAKAVKLKLAK